MSAVARLKDADRAAPFTIEPQAFDHDRIAAFSHFMEALELGLPAAKKRKKGCLLVGPNEEQIPIPPAMFEVLRATADILASGGSVRIVPLHQELTTQEAADMLNMSRQYLVRLLEAGELAFKKTGTHRRIRMDDLLAYKHKRDAHRRRGLRDLTRIGEEADGPDEFPKGGEE
jgi:excisionase family DNA binding protein